MGDNDYLNNGEQDVNSNFEYETLMKKVGEELSKSYSQYKGTLRMMAGDAPIQAMCLDKATENILLRNGLNRVHDLFDCDFVKIEGLGEVRIRHLTACLHEFLSVL